MGKDARQLAVEKTASSGLTEKDMKQLGFVVLPPDKVKKLFPGVNTLGAPGLKLTYYDISGDHELDTFRVRLLGELKGAFGEQSKLRYLQPAGTPPAPYFPSSIDWTTIADDTKIPIIVTEGELKAACAAKYGYACVGLGGVSSFRSAKRGMELLPELEQIDWVRREVYICYDSDARTNPDIAAATAQIIKVLSARGAIVRVVELPEVEGLKKTGLDDLIVARGPDIFQAALDKAPCDELSRKLWEFNERFIAIESPPIVYDIADDRDHMIEAGKFKTFVMANIWATQQTLTADGTPKLKRVPVADEWIMWPMRAQAPAMTYAPGDARFIDGRLNAWTAMGVEPLPGDVALWKKLIKHLFLYSAPEEMRWFEDQCLYPLRYIGTKLKHASLLWSRRTGLGKSLVGDLLGKIYGPKNFSQVTQASLERDFNGWQVNKQFVMFDDISSFAKYTKADTLKPMVTSDTMEVNIKGIATYQAPNRTNFYLTSNKADALYLEDDDRRFFVHEVTSPKLDAEFFRQFVEWMKGTGPANLFHYAIEKHKFLPTFDPFGPAFRTQSREDMVDAAKSESELWVKEMARQPDALLRLGEFEYRRDLFSCDELLALFDVSRKGTPVTRNIFALKLRDQFMVANGGKPVCVDVLGERFYIVRGGDKWVEASSADIAKHVREGRAQEQGKKGGKY